MIMYSTKRIGFGLISVMAFSIVFATLFTIWPFAIFAEDSVSGTQGYATEVQGALDSQGDMHIFGVQPDAGASSVVLTLVCQIPDDALVRDGLALYALQEDGLMAYLAGAPLSDSFDSVGRTVLAGQEGVVRQLELSPNSDSGTTVIVANTWFEPARYQLTIHGGTLIDEGGQSLVSTAAERPYQETADDLYVQMSSVDPAHQAVEQRTGDGRMKSIKERKALVRRPSMGVVPVRSASTNSLHDPLSGFYTADATTEP